MWQILVCSTRRAGDAVAADVNVRDKNGLTALDWARKWGETGITRMLREAGATGAPASPQTAGGTGEQAGGHSPSRGQKRSAPAIFQPAILSVERCAGCHHQMLGGILVALARAKGLAVNEGLAAQQIEEILAERAPAREALLQRQRVGGYPMRDSLLLVSLAAQKYPADAFTDAVVYNLMGRRIF